MSCGAAPPRVVLDTMIFVQALISGRGMAAGCINRLKAGRFVLFVSKSILAEMSDVPLRPELTRKYTHLTPERVSAFYAEIEPLSVLVPDPPKSFQLPRDANDEMFLDLAIAGRADYVVTWNERHLTYLMKADTPEGRDFCSRFPGIRILSPPAFLNALDANPAA